MVGHSLGIDFSRCMAHRLLDHFPVGGLTSAPSQLHHHQKSVTSSSPKKSARWSIPQTSSFAWGGGPVGGWERLRVSRVPPHPPDQGLHRRAAQDGYAGGAGGRLQHRWSVAGSQAHAGSSQFGGAQLRPTIIPKSRCINFRFARLGRGVARN